MANGLSVIQDAFEMKASVPDNVMGMPADGEWAAWHGVTSTPKDGRDAVVLVSITVTAFHPGKAVEDELCRRLRARHPGRDERVEQFTTADGNPAVCLRRVATKRVSGRDVTTGQAQVLVAYPETGALGVVSGVALHPDDLDRAAELVTDIAAGMTVTSVSAAA